MSADQAIKEPARLATAANITLSGLQTIDGVTTVAGDRVLARAQTSAVNNGIYVAASGAWSRATDFDGAGEVVGGTQVAVTSGTDRAGSAWRVAGAGPIVIGTDPIPFERAYDSESVTFLQEGSGTTARSVEDKLRDCLDVRDFAGADPTGTNPSTAAFQAAIAAAVAQGKTLRISRGEWLLDDSLLSGSLITNLAIVGDGIGATRIVNRAAGKPLFNIGNTQWCTLSDFSVDGDADCGHAIDMTNPGTIGASTFYPAETKLSRLWILGHTGVDTGESKSGASMPACGVYMAGSLGALLDNVIFNNNSFGVYAYLCAQPEIRTCQFDLHNYGAVINDQCENLRMFDADIVGDNAHTEATIKVGAGGDQASGYTVKGGHVVDYFGKGSMYLGGKFKNHKYAAFSLHSPSCPLVTGAWIRQEVDGCIGVYNAFGARVIANEFTLAEAGFSGTRTGVLAEPQGGYNDFGVIDQNEFSYGGDGDYGTFVEVDASGAFYVSGTVRGNKAGSANPVSATSTLDAFIKVGGGGVRKVAVADNHVTAPDNLTVTVAYDYGGVSGQVDEGLIDSANSSWDYFGLGTITTVKSLPASNAYTGLQASGKLNVNALTVQGTQVVGARNTGWTAATGTAAKGAYATYAGQTVSNPPTQGQVQATDNAVKALSQRFKALEDAARAHGLIN